MPRPDTYTRLSVRQAETDGIDEFASLLRHPDLLGHRFLADTTELFVGPALARFFGTTPQALTGRRWLDMVPQEEQEAIRAHLETYSRDAPFGVHENTGFGTEGRRFSIRWFNQAVFDEAGRLKYFEAVGMDITEQKRLAEKLKSAKAVADAIIDTLPELYYMIDMQGNYLRWNKELENITGYHPDQIGRMHPLDFVSDKDRESALEAMQRTVREGQAEEEIEIVTRAGDRLPYLFKARRAVVEGKTVINGFGLNISDRKRLESDIRHQATHDSLTGLWNRGAFEEAMSKEIERAKRHGQCFCLVMLDLDHFKTVNDKYGHAVGDEALRQLADLMKSRFRTTDITARWGGEEFMALLPETAIDGARTLAEDFRLAVEGTVFPDAGRMTVSLGVVQYDDGQSPDALVKRADEALYAAKEAGRNRVVVAWSGTGEESPSNDSFNRHPDESPDP